MFNKEIDTKISTVARYTDREMISRPVYKRFYYTRQLLQNKYHEFIQKLGNKDILEKFEILLKTQNFSDKEFDKLLSRIDKWNRLEAPVPLLYLEYIGLDTSTILSVSKADLRSFREAIKARFYPECFYLNTDAGILRVGLPENTSEKEAIQIAIDYHVKEKVKGRYVCIKDLKTIVIEPDNSWYTYTYPPVLSVRNGMLIPGETGNTHDGISFV